MRRELVPDDRLIPQPENAHTYRCPICDRPIPSQYAGAAKPWIVCPGVRGPHVLEWPSDAVS